MDLLHKYIVFLLTLAKVASYLKERSTDFLSHPSSITNSTIRRFPLILEMVIVISQHIVMCIL